jgi:serine/threonine protein kinase/class 3 adenylate cyclase
VADPSDREDTSTNGEAPTQLRTFLIADIRGYTRFTHERGDEAAAHLASVFAAITTEVIERRGGQLVELRGDEALATFVSARQALRAAAELQARYVDQSLSSTEDPLPVGIGLDAGEAVSVAGGYRGGALNLAARLCSLAGPGEILAHQAIVHLARKMEDLEYVERGSMEIKGFAEPVQVVEVRPLTPSPSPSMGEGAGGEGKTQGQHLPIGTFLGSLPSNPLIGREEEMERVSSAVDRVAGGSGQLLVLAGAAGLGKTRVAQEATLLCRNREFVLATGRCYAPQRDIAFYPFVEALSMAYEAAPPGLQATLARRWPQLSRLLPDHITAAPTPSSDPAEEQLRLFRAVAGFVTALAGVSPVALLLDDLHHADPDSIALLAHLARTLRSSPVLLLGAYRDTEIDRQHPLDVALRDLSREGLVERITLRRFSEDETSALIAATIGEMEASEEFAAYVHRRTRGNPHFILEMLRSLGGRYRILREIGAGGMGRVFEAVDTRTGQHVAAKLMFASSEASFDALLRFQQEGAVLASLKHPHIVEVYSTFTEEHASCIVMELLQGRPLCELLRGGVGLTHDRVATSRDDLQTPAAPAPSTPSPSLDLARIKTIAQQTASALAYAHSKSIVHRDVKPDNIIITSGDQVKVTDFGIARILRPDATMQTLQSTGMTLGTPLYMAPEQIEGKKVDGRADVYALGAVLYQMVTGHPPFEGTDPVTIAYKQVHEAPHQPTQVAAALPPDWEETILHCLAKSPDERFPSAAAMEEAIESLSTEPFRQTETRLPRKQIPPPRPRPADDSPHAPTPAPVEMPTSPASAAPLRGLGLESLGQQITSMVHEQLASSLEEARQRQDEARQKRRGAATIPEASTERRRLEVAPFPWVRIPWPLAGAILVVLIVAAIIIFAAK